MANFFPFWCKTYICRRVQRCEKHRGKDRKGKDRKGKDRKGNQDCYKKKCETVRLGVIYDSQATNRKLGGIPVRALLPPAALLLVAWESYVTPSQPEYTKRPSRTGGSSYFLIEKSP